MAKVNITAAQKKHLNKSGLDIYFDYVELDQSDGNIVTEYCLVIDDKAESDFMVAYTINKNQSYDMVFCPKYVETGLQNKIESTRDLTKICKHIAEVY